MVHLSIPRLCLALMLTLAEHEKAYRQTWVRTIVSTGFVPQ